MCTSLGEREQDAAEIRPAGPHARLSASRLQVSFATPAGGAAQRPGLPPHDAQGANVFPTIAARRRRAATVLRLSLGCLLLWLLTG